MVIIYGLRINARKIFNFLVLTYNYFQFLTVGECMNVKIIGLAGSGGSGKTFIGDMLASKLSKQQKNIILIKPFAADVKQVCSLMTNEEKINFDLRDRKEISFFPESSFTRRELMREIADLGFRIHEKFWFLKWEFHLHRELQLLFKTYKNKEIIILVPDVRLAGNYLYGVDFIRNLGGEVWFKHPKDVESKEDSHISDQISFNFDSDRDIPYLEDINILETLVLEAFINMKATPINEVIEKISSVEFFNPERTS